MFSLVLVRSSVSLISVLFYRCTFFSLDFSSFFSWFFVCFYTFRVFSYFSFFFSFQRCNTSPEPQMLLYHAFKGWCCLSHVPYFWWPLCASFWHHYKGAATFKRLCITVGVLLNTIIFSVSFFFGDPVYLFLPFFYLRFGFFSPFFLGKRSSLAAKNINPMFWFGLILFSVFSLFFFQILCTLKKSFWKGGQRVVAKITVPCVYSILHTFFLFHFSFFIYFYVFFQGGSRAWLPYFRSLRVFIKLLYGIFYRRFMNTFLLTLCAFFILFRFFSRWEARVAAEILVFVFLIRYSIPWTYNLCIITIYTDTSLYVVCTVLFKTLYTFFVSCFF